MRLPTLFGQHDFTQRVGSLLCGLTLVLFALNVPVYAVHNYVMPIEGAIDYFWVGSEANLPTWWNASLLLLTSAATGLAAFCANGKRVRFSWLVIALATAYLSLDEASRLHERLSQVVPEDLDIGTHTWLIPGAVLALFGTVVLVLVGRSLPRSTGRRFAYALAIYAAGALGAEAFNGWARFNAPGVFHYPGTMLEEGLEMVACIIALLAVLDHLLDALAYNGSPTPTLSATAPPSVSNTNPPSPQGPRVEVTPDPS